jgi:hypothetical protein
VVSEQVVKLTSWVGMAPKKNCKQASETRPEEPVEDLVAPSESIGEEEPNSRENQDEPKVGLESEEEQRSSVLFTPEQLDVATPLWPSVGVKPNTWKSWRLGVDALPSPGVKHT